MDGREGLDGEEHHSALLASGGTVVEEETLSVEIAEGRKMFFSAKDRRVTSHDGGVSCATCHFEGRMDGVTWRFQNGKERQTPSLAGDMSFQEVFTWTDNVPSIAAEARLTSADRMGGQGLTVTESRQIESFVNSTWYPDTALAGVSDQRALNGKALFEREDVGCATCHTGDHLTDQLPYDLFGLTGVRTPTLVGISATGPYLHDGSVSTLEQVLKLSDMAVMGDTSMLTEAEKADLVYYMKTF
jgi:cytochrome c peroxidase